MTREIVDDITAKIEILTTYLVSIFSVFSSVYSIQRPVISMWSRRIKYRKYTD